MKKIFRLFLAASLVAGFCFSFTACNPETEDRTGVITFEDVVLDSTGYWNGSDFSGALASYEDWGSMVHSFTGGFNAGILTCENVFYQEQTYFSSWWSGMACSSCTNMDSIGFGNQYSVYAASGAAESEKFGLVGSNGARCSFSIPIEVKSLMFNNSTYDYWALKDGKDGAGFVRKFEAQDYFYVTVTGYDSANVQTDQVEITLADFRDSQTYICNEWTKISLESLGKVKSLAFTFTSSDSGGYGMNTPAYVCIDNIVYIKN